MTPRKNRPVLFEVIARTQRARGRGFSVRPATPAQPAGAPGAPTGSGAAEPGFRPVPPRPYAPLEFFSVENGRLCLSLGWPHLAIAGAVIIGLCVAFYFIGRSGRSVPSAPVDNSAVAAAGQPVQRPVPERPAPKPGSSRGNAPAVNLRSPAGEEPPAAKAPEPPARAAQPQPGPAQLPPQAARQPAAVPKQPEPEPKLEAGAYHVVVQHFPASRKEEAEPARAFLASRNIPCVIKEGARGSVLLIAGQAFKSEEEAQGLVAKVLEAGKEYFKTTSTYDFHGAYAEKR